MRLMLGALIALITCPLFASDIIVTYKNNKCEATVDKATYSCCLGRNGLSKDKQEGDGTTPVGVFPLHRVFYRDDKISASKLNNVTLAKQAINPHFAWCDDPKDPRYNTLVDLQNYDLTLNYEQLWRDDDQYNIIIEVGYNDNPVVPGKGSAVFIRVAPLGCTGTPGGVAFSQKDLLKILPQLDATSKLIVSGS